MRFEFITAQDALGRLAEFSDVIDARSEGEFAEDHLPGALNWPTLNDAERQTVGTHYKQISAFEARKLGAAYAARNIAAHIERDVLAKPREWRPLLYCWRGGKRSGSLALVLDQIGFQVTVIEGGYKAFRAAMVLDLPPLAAALHYKVICGATGSGKTRLLQALRAQGAQVLDLEALANHRSSVLGLIPGVPQPTQKSFDRLIWTALKSFDPGRPVYVESESKKVGNVAVPEGLLQAMRRSPCLQMVMSEDERVALLLEDYDFFVRDTALFCTRLAALTQARGKETVTDWQTRVESGDIASVVRELLVKHYDPGYEQSMQRNFELYPQTGQIQAHSRSEGAMQALAASVLASS